MAYRLSSTFRNVILVSIFIHIHTAHGLQASSADFQKTEIFVYAPTEPGQLVFIRGGLSASAGVTCVNGNVSSDPCAIPIQALVVPSDTSSSYYQLSQGDNFLDWYGREPQQGDFEGRVAQGTPLTWTTSNENNGATVIVDGYGYTPYNRFGDHYWYTELNMDCSRTSNGWFEFKVYMLATGWEQDINQYSVCAGQPLTSAPYTSINHMGICGKLNVFYENGRDCNIYEVPQEPSLIPPDTCGVSRMFTDAAPTYPSIAIDDPAIRIVNGYPASMGRWPWQVVLQYDQSIGGCAAALIDVGWAVTAAHCVRGTSALILKVRLGEQHLVADQGNEQIIQVRNIHIHECYQNPLCAGVEGDYDIALLEFTGQVAITGNYVTQISCLPHGYGLDDFVGETCFATGFGDTKGTGDSNRLYEINVPVYSHQDCVDIWGAQYISVRQVCMGTAEKSACGGDSGGPLVCWKTDRWVLVGVTSWGSSGCQGNPSVYSRITEFVPWIISIIQG